MSTMPKKGSRPITVDGRSYRWMVRTTVDKDALKLVVQDVANGETRQRTVRGYDGDPPAPVTSATVKEFILTKFDFEKKP